MDNGHTRLRGRDRGRPVGQGAEAMQGEGNATERSAEACRADARLGGDFGALPEMDSLVFNALEPSVCVVRVDSRLEGSLDVCDGARARREGDEGLSVSPTTYRRRSGAKAYQGLRVCR